MARATAERQQEFRKRVNAGTVKLLQSKLDSAIEHETELAVTVAGLEAELEQARAAASCPHCGTPLACPQCHGGGEYA